MLRQGLLILCMLFFNLLSAEEEFIYQTKFRNLRVGNTQVNITPSIQNNVKQFILTINSSTNKIIDLVYKLRHFSTIIVNAADFSLITTTKKIQQGKYIDSYTATVDYDLKQILYQNTKDISYRQLENQLILPIEGPVYDPFSIVYYLRNFNLHIGETYNFISYNKKKTRDIELYVEKIEKLRTPYLTADCFVVVPRHRGEGPLLKNQGEMKIWFTADSNQFPIKIQQKMTHGIMELNLKDYVKK